MLYIVLSPIMAAVITTLKKVNKWSKNNEGTHYCWFQMLCTLLLWSFFLHYNLSAILPRAFASLSSTATMLLAVSFWCWRSSWKLMFWASSCSLSILPFFSNTSINWLCKDSSSSSVGSRFRFRSPWDVEPISGFEAGCFSLLVPVKTKECMNKFKLEFQEQVQIRISGTKFTDPKKTKVGDHYFGILSISETKLTDAYSFMTKLMINSEF